MLNYNKYIQKGQNGLCGAPYGATRATYPTADHRFDPYHSPSRKQIQLKSLINKVNKTIYDDQQNHNKNKNYNVKNFGTFMCFAS